MLAVVMIPSVAMAQTLSEVTVSGYVPSPVDATLSKVEVNTPKTMADPISHPILVYINLVDKENSPLSNKLVVVDSNRGSADAIESMGKLAKKAVEGEFKMNQDYTDDMGRVSFRLTSFIPGQVNLSITADNMIKLSPVQVEFVPRPFPAYLDVRVDLPFSQRDLYLVSSSYNEGGLTNLQKESAESIDIGSEIRIPFWLLLIIFLIIVIPPMLLIINIINVRKMRKEQAEIIDGICLTKGCPRRLEDKGIGGV